MSKAIVVPFRLNGTSKRDVMVERLIGLAHRWAKQAGNAASGAAIHKHGGLQQMADELGAEARTLMTCAKDLLANVTGAAIPFETTVLCVKCNAPVRLKSEPFGSATATMLTWINDAKCQCEKCLEEERKQRENTEDNADVKTA